MWAGASTITSTPGAGQTAALTFASLARTGGGTVAFAGAGLGTTANQVVFTAAPTLTSDILAFATVGNNFATYGASGDAANTNFQTTLTGATATTNVVLTDPGTLAPSAATSVNSLVIITTGVTAAVINPAGFALNVTSGGLLTAGTANATISGGTLAFGAAEGVIGSGAGVSTTISNAVTGTAGLTLAGPGTVTPPAANGFTGTTTLTGGTVVLGSGGVLGGGTINLVAGTVQATAPLTVSNTVTLTNAAVTFAGANPVPLTGVVTLGGASSTLTATKTGGLALAGQIVGTGALVVSGATFFTNAFGAVSSYTRQTTFLSGIASTQAASAFGANSAVVVAGTGAAVRLQSVTGFNLNRPLVLNGTGVGGRGAVENVAGNNTLSGNVTLATPTTVGVTTGIVVYNTGCKSGPADMAKVGAGVLAINANNTNWTGSSPSPRDRPAGRRPVRARRHRRRHGRRRRRLAPGANSSATFTQANTFTGPVAASGSTITLSGAGAFAGTTGLTLNHGGTIRLDNAAATNTNHVTGAAAVTLNGGTLAFVGGPTAAATETLGALTVNSGPPPSASRRAAARTRSSRSPASPATPAAR